MNELEARVALTVARKFTPLALRNLFEKFHDAETIVQQSADALKSVPKVNRNAPKALAEVIRNGHHLREIEEAESAGIRLVTDLDHDYPPLLKRTDDPPPLLYVKGTLNNEDVLSVAIVGSRKASYYGTSQAGRFAREFASRGVTVVSGLARGIDSSAHHACIGEGGRTLAFVGSGLLDVYPPENRRFVDTMAESGAAISEFPLHTPGVARNFPQRNRLISGASLGVLVIEAGLKSGSLITARLAGEQGREVFALPGKVDDERSRGAHKLIRDGATLVESPAHVFEVLDALADLPDTPSDDSDEPKTPRGLSPTENHLWASLKPSDGLTPDELSGVTGLPVAQITSGLMMLEMKGLARSLPGKRFVRG